MATTASSKLLAVEDVSVFYEKFRAINHVDIAVEAGEVVSIIGANGAGKSTLLKAIIGQADHVEGNISFAGETIIGRTTEAIVASGIMLVPEGRRLFPSLPSRKTFGSGGMSAVRVRSASPTSGGCFRCWRTGGGKRPDRFPAASSRWLRSGARFWLIRGFSCATRSASAWRRL